MAHNTHTHDDPSSDNAEPHLEESHATAHDDAMSGKSLTQILREIMVLKEWNQTELAKHLKVTQPTVSRWFKGSDPEWEQRGRIIALARRFNVVERTYALDAHGVPLVGYVGAGGTIQFNEGQGPFGDVQMPPGNVPTTTVAVKVQGDSMAGMLEDGWLVYYDDRHEKPTEDLYNKLCVVGLADGRVLIKKLIPGRAKGTYTLLSINAAALLDQTVTWAARVTFIQPS